METCDAPSTRCPIILSLICGPWRRASGGRAQNDNYYHGPTVSRLCYILPRVCLPFAAIIQYCNNRVNATVTTTTRPRSPPPTRSQNRFANAIISLNGFLGRPTRPPPADNNRSCNRASNVLVTKRLKPHMLCEWHITLFAFVYRKYLSRPLDIHTGKHFFR